MRIPVNLASQPRENLRPLRVAVAFAAVAALLLTVVIVQRERRSRDEFRSLTERIAALQREQAELQREQRELEEWMATPQVQQIRERSAFLNSLILRKSISWTRMFLDLEKTLPARARITAIRPKLSDSQQAELALTVVGESIEPLVEFLKRLESSPQFGSPTVGAQRFPSDRARDNLISLDLTTLYRQTPQPNPTPEKDESAPAGELARAGGAGESAREESR